jgi:hypothetical protein
MTGCREYFVFGFFFLAKRGFIFELVSHEWEFERWQNNDTIRGSKKYQSLNQGLSCNSTICRRQRLGCQIFLGT